MESAQAEKMMAGLTAMIDSGSTVGKTFSKGDKSYKVSVLDNFSYTDPIDNSVSTKQVRRCHFFFRNLYLLVISV